MKQKHIVDTQKFLTAFVVLALIAAYGQWDNPTAWLYLALHGTYGMIWLVKSRVFPDKRWEQPVSVAYAIGMSLTLALYWLAPWLIVSRGVQAPGWYAALCVSLYTVGIFLHYTADMQKHMALALRPGHLIDDGLWARVRNPNYLGELLIYVGFGALAMHWLPFVVLGGIVAVIWVPNMLAKDRSLVRYPEYKGYRRRSRWLIPFLL
jgi:protein-S-isoprenylcysteine O-methyltransferase Ste14